MKSVWVKPPRLSVVCVALAMLLCLPACEKLDAEGLALLQTAALAAKERAVYFAAVGIKAKDEAQAGPVAVFVAAHREGLASQAKGIADLVEAVKSKRLSGTAVEALVNESRVAKERALNFTAMLPFLDMPDEVATVHVAALIQQADTLGKLAAKLKPAKEKPKE